MNTCATFDFNARLTPIHRFVVASLSGIKHTTPVVKKTLNPVFQESEATFDFPIYLSLAGRLGVLELVVWDKDRLKKDYLGETSLHLEDWFTEGSSKAYDDPENTVGICMLKFFLMAYTSATGLHR